MSNVWLWGTKWVWLSAYWLPFSSFNQESEQTGLYWQASLYQLIGKQKTN